VDESLGQGGFISMQGRSRGRCSPATALDAGVQRSWLDANEQGRGWVLIHASAQRLLYLKIDNNFVNIVSTSAWHLIKTPSIWALLRIFQRAHAMAAKANRYMCLDFPFIPWKRVNACAKELGAYLHIKRWDEFVILFGQISRSTNHFNIRYCIAKYSDIVVGKCS
jgi:hypothetical protein